MRNLALGCSPVAAEGEAELLPWSVENSDPLVGRSVGRSDRFGKGRQFYYAVGIAWAAERSYHYEYQCTLKAFN